MGQAGYAGTVAERMERKRTVDPTTGCWNWHGSKDTKGYGQIRIDGRARIATHIALELAGRPRPPKACALHRCDNPACVNPDHLWWGTMKENIQDCIAKGRFNSSGLKVGHAISAASKAPPPVVVCHKCGKSFETRKEQFLKNLRHFCSRDCCWTWQRENFSGAKRDSFSRLEPKADMYAAVAA